jgi:hypothetical protein
MIATPKNAWNVARRFAAPLSVRSAPSPDGRRCGAGWALSQRARLLLNSA